MKESRKWLILVLMGVFLAIMFGYSEGAEKTYGNIVVEVVGVYDGDTFKVNVDGWPDIIGKNISIRIYGVDTPEIRGTRGAIKDLAMLAKAFTDSELTLASKVELRNIRRGKYFRIIAEVYVDDVNLGDLLIKRGFAKEYYGGKRPVW